MAIGADRDRAGVMVIGAVSAVVQATLPILEAPAATSMMGRCVDADLGQSRAD